MKADSKYYVCHGHDSLAPAAIHFNTWDIVEYRRKLRLIRLIWSHRIQDNATLQIIPAENNQTQDYLLQCTEINNSSIGRDFLNPLIAFADSGFAWTVYRPGEYNPNGFYFDQNIHFTIQITNNDLLNIVDHDYIIYAEVLVIWTVD